MQTARRILAICDEDFELEVLRGALPESVSLTTARTEAEAGQRAAARPPDLMLVDIALAGIDGQRICARVRSDPLLSRTRVMLLGGAGSREAELEAYRAGADDYLGRPVDTDRLRARTDVLLRLSSLEAETVQMKGELLDLLAHEIRTPLTGVLPPAEILATEALMDDDQRMMWGRMIVDNCRRLSSLMDRAMVLNELRSGTRAVRLEHTDLEGVVRGAVDEFRDKRRPAPRVELEIAACAHGTADRDLLRTAVTVLLESAESFTSQEPRLSVRLWSEGSAPRLSVTVPDVTDRSAVQTAMDTFAPRIAGDQVVGWNLGLALARRVLEAHGGHVEVRFEPGATGFFCELPPAGAS